jgi:sulfofructose kinase
VTIAPRQARILVIGHACLDSISITTDSAPEDGKLEADRIWVGPGGPATNAAIALSRLGHEVWLAIRFADDPAGRIVAAALEAEGVRCLVAPVDEGSTSLAQIRARGDARSVVWKRGRLPALEAEPRMLEEWFDGVEMLYVDGHEVPAASAAIQHAARAGVSGLADPGSLRAGAEDWPARLDSFVATPRWLEARYPGIESVEDAVAALARDARPGALVGVTLGLAGGLAVQGGERVTWRARKTGAVDTTVAGDAFHAGLADAMLQGMDLPAALDWAATLAAAVCRAPGHAALPKDREQLQLWHGRWGHRPAAAATLYATSPAAL